VTVALASELEQRGLIVRPILCVHRAELPFFQKSPQGVTITDGRGLVKLLSKAGPRISYADVAELARLAHERLPPALKPNRPPGGPPSIAAPPVQRPAPSLRIPPPPEDFSSLEGDELYMPPTRREQIRLAREARARATDKRTYWTREGLEQGHAPPTLPQSTDRTARE
jgi:hypothetical protein